MANVTDTDTIITNTVQRDKRDTSLVGSVRNIRQVDTPKFIPWLFKFVKPVMYQLQKAGITNIGAKFIVALLPKTRLTNT